MRLFSKLPSSYFSTMPDTDTLRMLNITYGQDPTPEKDTLLTPSKKYSKKFNGVPVNITEYIITYGSATTSTGLMEYQFDGIKETDDSLIFYNVTKTFGGKIFPLTTSFVKGNITVVDSTDNNIEYIDISAFFAPAGLSKISRRTPRLVFFTNRTAVGP